MDYVKNPEKDYFVNSTMLPTRYVVNKQGHLELKDRSLCPQKVSTPVITTDGDVLPYCFDIFGEHVLGNVTYKSEISGYLEFWQICQFQA